MTGTGAARGRRVLCGALVIIVAAAMATGCRVSPAKQTLGEAATQITGLRANAFSNRIRGSVQIDVVEPRVVGCIKQWLAAGKPVTAPDVRYHQDVWLRFGEDWIKDPYEVWFDDIGSGNPAYIEWNGAWYGLTGDLTALLQGLDMYEVGAWTVDPADKELLNKYGHVPAYLISKVTEWLPGRLKHRPGEFPTTIYWAIVNELGKDIGLDITPYLGEYIDVNIYKLAGELPEEFAPQRAYGRALIARQDDKIIGAWIDTGGYSGLDCSLKGNDLSDVTGKSLDDWMACVIDPTDPLEQRLAGLSPEDVIRTHYEAIDAHDYQLAHACESRTSLLNYLAYNRDRAALYRRGYEDDVGEGLGNITSVRVLKIERNEFYESDAPPGVRRYDVTIDETMKMQFGAGSGVNTPNAELRQETPQTGWRIYGVGYGR